MAATEASAKTPVHVTGRVHAGSAMVRETLSVQMCPESFSRDPGLLQAHARRCSGSAPTAIRQCVPVMTRPSESVTSTRSPTRLADCGAGAGHDVHAAAPEDVLQDGGGVRVLARQHPVAATRRG